MFLNPQISADELFLRACSVMRASDWSTDGRCNEEFLRFSEWASLISLAKDHGLHGVLYRGLTWAREQTGAEIPILEELHGLRRAQFAHNLNARDVLLKVTHQLQDRSIPFVPFKGVVLAEEIFDDLSLRSFADHDLLVPKSEVDRAIAAVKELGFSETPFADRAHWDEAGYHHVQLSHPDEGLVELHWTLFPPRLHPDVAEIIWEDCCSVSSDRDQVSWNEPQKSRPDDPPRKKRPAVPGQRLSPPLTLIHLAAHFAQHNFQVFPILVDFYFTAAKYDDQLESETVLKLAERVGARRMVQLAAVVCARIFPWPVSLISELAASSRSRSVYVTDRYLTTERLLHSNGTGFWSKFLLHVALADDRRSATRGALRALVPTRAELEMSFRRPFRLSMYPGRFLRAFRRS